MDGALSTDRSGLGQVVLRELWSMWSFVEKGMREMISYRLGFLLRCLYAVGLVSMFYFFGRIFQVEYAAGIAQYGGDYVAFVLVGLAFEDLYRAALGVYHNTVLSEQKAGTLEYLMSTNLGIHRYLHYSSLWGYVNALINTAIILLLGTLLFGAKLDANILAAGVIVVLMMVTIACLGIIAAGIVLVVKQGNPVEFVFNIVSLVFSGVIFPYTVLPAALQTVSQMLPLTYALHALRLALLQDYTVGMLMPQVTILACFALLLLPVSFLTLRWGYNRARREGSLAQY